MYWSWATVFRIWTVLDRRWAWPPPRPQFGQAAYVVTQRDKTLARELMERYDQAGPVGYVY